MPLKIINEKKFRKLPKAIIFDTDNTLYSYAPANELALKSVFSKAEILLDIKSNIFEEKFPNSSICVKLGSKGSLFFQNQKIIKSSALKNISVVDTCGAGDAFLAALCISDFDNITESLCVANYWAGLSTIINGTNPPNLLDLKKVLREK